MVLDSQHLQHVFYAIRVLPIVLVVQFIIFSNVHLVPSPDFSMELSVALVLQTATIVPTMQPVRYVKMAITDKVQAFAFCAHYIVLYVSIILYIRYRSALNAVRLILLLIQRFLQLALKSVEIR